MSPTSKKLMAHIVSGSSVRACVRRHAYRFLGTMHDILLNFINGFIIKNYQTPALYLVRLVSRFEVLTLKISA